MTTKTHQPSHLTFAKSHDPPNISRSSSFSSTTSTHSSRSSSSSSSMTSFSTTETRHDTAFQNGLLLLSKPTLSFTRRKLKQLALVCSLPVLGLLLALELHVKTTRTLMSSSSASPILDFDLDSSQFNITDFRARLQQDGEDVEDVSDRWPKWWGSGHVESSPWDHRPVIGEKKRLLFLTSYNDYLERMNTHTYEIVDAALRHPNIIADVWGPGWAGYDNTLSLSVNVRRRAHRHDQIAASRADHDQKQEQERLESQRQYRLRRQGSFWWSVVEVPRAEVSESTEVPWEAPPWEDAPDHCGNFRWDAVWTISDIFKQEDPLVDPLTCGALLVQQLGDCHELRCLKEWYPKANNITLSKYAFELNEIFSLDTVKSHFPDFQMGLFGHSPDTGNEWDFYPTTWSNKTSDATMFGFDGSFYPIRTTITDRNNAFKLDPTMPRPLIQHHRHPGYVIWPDDELRQNPLDTYTPGHSSYKTHRELRDDFARGMREARVCVFDASVERKMIRKYAQAFLSGCVVAGDIPTEHEEFLSRFMIPIQPSWKIERIEEEINKYLATPHRMHQMAVDAFIYARKYLTTSNKVSHVLAMIDSYNRGHRGYESSPRDAERIGAEMRIDRLGVRVREAWSN